MTAVTTTTSPWHEFLLERGACIEAGSVSHFGDPAGELRTTRDGSVVAPLTHLGVILCSGADAQDFLHAQLSNDVKKLAPSDSEYAAYCSPKGRMLANFVVWRDKDGYCLELARSLLPAILKRLAMYVLRAKVRLSDASETQVILGLAGSAAAASLQPFFPELPRKPHQVVHHPVNGTLIALSGERFQLIAQVEPGMRLWQQLSAGLAPVGARCWEWLEIKSGIPMITPATQEQFLPQMANMELIGAVNFQKGCYPGQEIVARAQYRGELKRRMVLAHMTDEGSPLPGDELFSAELPGQASGMVVNAQPAPGGGHDLLAVLQTASIDKGAVHFKSADGPLLHLQPLPYATV